VASAPLTVKVVGTGSCLPDNVLDNYDLYEQEGIRESFDVERARSALRGVEGAESLSAAEVFDRWSLQVTGISERRVLPWDEEATTETLSAEACRLALADGGLGPEDVDLLIASSVSPSDTVPNMACTIGSLLGIPQVPGYTVNAACAGFVYLFANAYAMILSGLFRNVLVVSGDALSRVTDYDDPKTAVLFGDGAGAAMLTPGSPNDSGAVVASPYIDADYSYEHLNMRSGGWEWDWEGSPKLRMGGGPHVLRAAINAMGGAARHALERTELGWDDIHYVIPHQANLRITRGLEKQLSLPNGRVVHTIDRYGNNSAGSVGIAFDEVLRGKHGPLPDPTHVLLTAVGGGYTSGATIVRWYPKD
jgi:3-oxoacyl-[acyl-carrier-protein] synthase-3